MVGTATLDAVMAPVSAARSATGAQPIAVPKRRARTPYLPGLDGLRALAVVAVMLYHANHGWLPGGFLGVEVFFVISGYLITLLMIGEHERDGRVSLRQFWIRRFRRLLPALYVMLSALAIYMAVTAMRARGRTRGDFIGAIAYGSNWYQIFVGQGYSAGEAFVPLRHLWSLAVEEQFYLLWPLVMWLLLRRGREALPRIGLWLAGVSAAIAVVVGVLFVSGDVDDIANCALNSRGYWHLAGRCISIDDTLYLSTFSRAGGLLLGAAMAMLWRPQSIMRGPLKDRHLLLDGLAMIGLFGLAALVRLLWLSEFGHNFGTRFNPWLFRGGFLLAGICTLLLISATTHRRSWVAKALGNPLLRWVGTRSYGLYLFHWPIYQIIRKEAGVTLNWGQFAVAMVITVPLTEVSYRFVETPIRQGAISRLWTGRKLRGSAIGERRRRQRVIGASVVLALIGFATVSIATAKNSCVGAVDCQQSASANGGNPLGLDPVTIATQPTVATTAAPVASRTTAATTITNALSGDTTAPTVIAVAPPTEAPTPAPTAPPFESIPPYAIGESVMQGAIPNLRAGGFSVNAEKGRGGAVVVQVLTLLQQRNQIGPIIVIQVGTNGTVTDAEFDQMMAIIGSRSTVYFMTVRAPRDYIAPNNARIVALPSRYPNVKIIDWATASNGIATLLCGGADQQTHISCSPVAAQVYANLIFSAVGFKDKVKPVDTTPRTIPPSTAPPPTTPPSA